MAISVHVPATPVLRSGLGLAADARDYGASAKQPRMLDGSSLAVDRVSFSVGGITRLIAHQKAAFAGLDELPLNFAGCQPGGTALEGRSLFPFEALPFLCLSLFCCELL